MDSGYTRVINYYPASEKEGDRVIDILSGYDLYLGYR